jgi:uncharacterized protein (TIGR00251 family)
MVCVNIARSGNRNIFLSLEANLSRMCIIFNLLGLATGVAGALTAVDIFPAFIGSGLTSPALVTAVFWWAISIVLCCPELRSEFINPAKGKLSGMTESCRLNLKVTPNSRANQVTGVLDGIVGIKIKAPPTEGKANTELVNYLSNLLNIPKSAVTIIRGHTSRNKSVEISGMGAEDLSARLGI